MSNVVTTQITIPERFEELPTMEALANDCQRAFVYLLVVEGMDQPAAYRAAGYKVSNDNVAHAGASRLAHSPGVQAAILELGRAFARVAGTKALRALVKIIDAPGAKDRDKIAAAAQLLDRSGFSSSTTHELLIEHKHTVPELKAQILALAAKHGFDGAALVGDNPSNDPNILEGQYTVVTDQEPPIPDQLKDLFE